MAVARLMVGSWLEGEVWHGLAIYIVVLLKHCLGTVANSPKIRKTMGLLDTKCHLDFSDSVREVLILKSLTF